MSSPRPPTPRSSTASTQELTRIAVGDAPPGWHRYDDLLNAPAAFTPDAATNADDPLLLYFTSGTTAKPKLVLHSHRSYPIGHLTTMYAHRPPARRCPPQCRLPGLGQARLELFLRAVERRRDGVRLQPAALRRQGPAGGDHPPIGSRRFARRRRCGACWSRKTSKSVRHCLREADRRRRTAQPRGHRDRSTPPGA